MAIAVNDGLRQKLQLGGGWLVDSIRPQVQKLGNAQAFARYLEIAREKLSSVVAYRGYRIAKWAGYYTGHNHGMTHYGAILVREGSPR